MPSTQTCDGPVFERLEAVQNGFGERWMIHAVHLQHSLGLGVNVANLAHRLDNTDVFNIHKQTKHTNLKVRYDSILKVTNERTDKKDSVVTPAKACTRS